MTLAVTEAAWLAGLWDGEGSVGVANSRATGTLIYIPQIQICMTHESTIAHAVTLLDRLGCAATSYTIVEGKQYQDSYRFAVRRTAWVQAVAAALLPYAVTKRQHWELIHDLCVERIARQGICAHGGGLRRGGAPGWAKPYTKREHELVAALRAVNANANRRSAQRMEASA